MKLEAGKKYWKADGTITGAMQALAHGTFVDGHTKAKDRDGNPISTAQSWCANGEVYEARHGEARDVIVAEYEPAYPTLAAAMQVRADREAAAAKAAQGWTPAIQVVGRGKRPAPPVDVVDIATGFAVPPPCPAVRTIQRREIIPGTYGILTIPEGGNVRFTHGHRTSPFTSAELLAAVRVLVAMAEALDFNARAGE